MRVTTNHELPPKNLEERFKAFCEIFNTKLVSRDEYRVFNILMRVKLWQLCHNDTVPVARHRLNDILGRKNHLFHIVFPSIWPFITSSSVFSLLSSFAFYFNGVVSLKRVILFSVLTVCCTTGRFCAIIDEATYKGHHTLVVRNGIKIGSILLSVSEAVLFSALFRTFFYFTLLPSAQVAFTAPAPGIYNVHYLGVPFSNTCLLTCSSLSVT